MNQSRHLYELVVLASVFVWAAGGAPIPKGSSESDRMREAGVAVLEAADKEDLAFAVHRVMAFGPEAIGVLKATVGDKQGNGAEVLRTAIAGLELQKPWLVAKTELAEHLAKGMASNPVPISELDALERIHRDLFSDPKANVQKLLEKELRLHREMEHTAQELSLATEAIRVATKLANVADRERESAKASRLRAERYEALEKLAGENSRLRREIIEELTLRVQQQKLDLKVALEQLEMAFAPLHQERRIALKSGKKANMGPTVILSGGWLEIGLFEKHQEPKAHFTIPAKDLKHELIRNEFRKGITVALAAIRIPASGENPFRKAEAALFSISDATLLMAVDPFSSYQISGLVDSILATIETDDKDIFKPLGVDFLFRVKGTASHLPIRFQTPIPVTIRP